MLIRIRRHGGRGSDGLHQAASGRCIRRLGGASVWAPVTGIEEYRLMRAWVVAWVYFAVAWVALILVIRRDR